MKCWNQYQWNVFVILKCNFDDRIFRIRKKFLKDVALGLCEGKMKRRLANERLPKVAQGQHSPIAWNL